MKNSVQGATEGAKFIQDHIIHVTDKAFNDFAGGKQDDNLNRAIPSLNAH